MIKHRPLSQYIDESQNLLSLKAELNGYFLFNFLGILFNCHFFTYRDLKIIYLVKLYLFFIKRKFKHPL